MESLLAYLGPLAPAAAGALAWSFIQRLWKKNTEKVSASAVTAVVEPLNAALATISEDLASVRRGLASLEQTRVSQVAYFAETTAAVTRANEVALKALEVANRVEGSFGQLSAQFASHVSRYPHNHSGGSGYSEGT